MFMMSDLKRKVDDLDESVTLVVGGLTYVLKKDVILRHPDSFLANLIKPKWRPSGEKPINIDRDGTLFQYVYDYLRYGFLPRDKNGLLVIDAATKTELVKEADFYMLQDLAKECQEDVDETGFGNHLKAFNYVKRTISNSSYGSKWVIPNEVVRLPHKEEDPSFPGDQSRRYTTFGDLLKGLVAPFCVVGKLDPATLFYSKDVYKSSTICELNMEELLAEAKLSPFGKGLETVIDTSVRHSYEIDLSKTNTFNTQFVIDISSLNKDPTKQELDIRPYKLVIYKEGGHFEAHRDTVRGDGHIGTLVLILNSEYTGGELEVTHGGRTEVVTGPYSWVAMYGDCLHKINPVTSGTRVSLIYDIYSKNARGWYYEEGHDVWKSRYYSSFPLRAAPKDANEAQKQAVIEGMHAQLVGFDSAVICLQHLYPACQANPDFLKGGDQLLYDILRDHFTLAVLPCTIYRKRYDEDVRINNDPHEDFKESSYCVKPMALPNGPPFHAAMVEEALKLKTNFIVFDHLTYNHVIESNQLDYTGNDAQGEETVYMVAGLQVREKK